ncbi:MAG: BlaI/MecI/CopY family transcriptional regulator [Bacteroidota bacterium]
MKALTRKEEEVMKILWKLERAFVKDILELMPDPKPHYNTVSSMVRFMEDKGYIGHKAYGKTHEYFPLISKESYSKQSLSNLVSGYFSNSYKSVISFMAKEEEISIEELKEIISMIENESSDHND